MGGCRVWLSALTLKLFNWFGDALAFVAANSLVEFRSRDRELRIDWHMWRQCSMPPPFLCFYCFHKPDPSHTDSIYTDLSLHPFNCTRNSPHRHLTKCRSYRFENLWIQIQLSRRCPDFLVYFILITRDANLHHHSYLLTIPLCGQWKVQWSEPEYWLCFSVGYYSTWLWIRLSIQSCVAIPQDWCMSLMFSRPIGGEIMWQLFFESLYSFYWEMRLNKCRASGRLV